MTPPQPLPFSALLKQQRRAQGMTQAELAEKAGYSPMYISMLERGARMPTASTAEHLAEALELTHEQHAIFMAAARPRSDRVFAVFSAAEDPFRATCSTSSQDARVHTFLIANVRSFTRFTLEYGDEAAARLTAQFTQLARETVQIRDGRVFELRGAEVLTVFVSARQALHAAVELQACCTSATTSDPTLPLSIGIGLDAGEAVLVADSYQGAAVTIASRLCGLCGPGEVLSSKTVIDLAHTLPGLVYRNHGVVSLPGSAEPIQVVRILTEDEARVEGSHDRSGSVLRRTGDNNLPIQLTSFVGRTREVAEVKSLLARTRLLTLTGAGGSGKTRLALQVADELSDANADGVWFVRLSRLVDPTLVVSTIAHTLGLHETGEQPIAETLTGYLCDKQTLLVLDNFEQVAAAATEVAALLESCAGLRVLVTSRVALRLRGEKEYQVQTLPVPDPAHLPPPDHLLDYAAVALFVQRVQDAVPEFAVANTTAQAIAAICARLDGLPLAIELAAAKMRMLAPPALWSAWSGSCRYLSAGRAIWRHGNKRCATRWSGATTCSASRNGGCFDG